MSPLHVVGAVVLFLALGGMAGMIGVKITSLGGQSGPKVIAAEKSTGLEAERQEAPARLTLFKHREYALDTYSHIFAKGNRDTNLKDLPGYQSAGTKGGGLDLIAVEGTPFSSVNKNAVDEAKPIPRETLFEPLTTATEKTKATLEKHPVPKQVEKATRIEVRKAKAKAVARHKSKSLARKPKGSRVKKRQNIENAAERKVPLKEVASPVGRVTEERVSKAVERPAAAKQEHPSNNSSGECLPRAFRSYIAGRMRPCDYW